MCGIAGFTWEDKALLKQMTDIQAHRGPEGEGFHLEPGISLGHRRLKIIDLSDRAKNPLYNEDGTICVVYNGEIYNFKAVRAELERLGHRFSSDADTEVVVHGYEAWGLGAVRRFNGMFAFALWDADKQLLWLCRDRLGIKPLHYAYDPAAGRLIFASEIKAILLHEVARRLNKAALNCFLNFNYIMGAETLFEGIFRLPPGHSLVHRDGSIAVTQYWSLDSVKAGREKAPGQYAAEIRRRLTAATQLQLISDVPLGLYLSGGVDSSFLLALMSRIKKEQGDTAPVKTYAVGFNEPWDETADARAISEHFGGDHHELVVESDVLAHYPKFVWHMDAPKTNISPQYYVSELAKKTVTVALTGLGGDELFGGYRRHRAYALAPLFAKAMPTAIRRPVAKALARAAPTNFSRRAFTYLADAHDPIRTYGIGAPQLLFERERAALYGKQLAPYADSARLAPCFRGEFSAGEPFYDQTLKFEVRQYLPNDLLERLDRMAMAASVEARVPYLDHAFVEYAFSIPSRLRRFPVFGTRGKPLLEAAARPLLPARVFAKRKTGFNMSPYYWFKGALRDHAAHVLTPGRLRADGLFRPEFVEKILAAPPDPGKYYQYQILWNLLVFQVWRQIYLEGGSWPPAPRIEAHYG